MPFSKTPSISTYETKRVQFLGSPQERTSSSSKDQRFVNFLAEVIDPLTKRLGLRTRPGVQSVTNVGATGAATGFYVWDFPYDGTHLAKKFVFAVVGGVIYINGVANTTSGIYGGVGACGFAEHVDSVGTRTLIMVTEQGQIVIWDYAAANATYSPVIIYAGIPAWTAGAKVKNATATPTVSNGYYYIATTAGTTAGAEPVWPTTVGNTVVDGTVTWTCKAYSGFPTKNGMITLVPTPIVLDSYVFVNLKNDIDIWNSDVDDPYSWTSGNYISAELYADPITALSKNNNYIYAVGSRSVEMFYDAANPTGTPLARNETGVKQFGCPASSWRSVVQTDKEIVMVGGAGAGGYSVWTLDGFKEKDIGIPAVRFYLNSIGAANLYAYVINVVGQKLYVLTLQARTWVYSFETEMWFEWTSGDLNYFVYTYGQDSGNGYPYVLHYNNGYYGSLYEENPLTEPDSPYYYICSIITEKKDFDTINNKLGHRFSLIGDTTGTSISVRWSDDDYTTWSAFRSITMSQEHPYINQLGKFRRRAFHIQFTASSSQRLEGFEIDINKGQA